MVLVVVVDVAVPPVAAVVVVKLITWKLGECKALGFAFQIFVMFCNYKMAQLLLSCLCFNCLNNALQAQEEQEEDKAKGCDISCCFCYF